MPALSVAIITHNEEANLARTLRSLPEGCEVVVVDSGSTDGTLTVASQYGARVIEQPWLGFAVQKNLALSECTGDWVLSLDADEELSPALRDEIVSLVQGQPLPGKPEAYFVPRKNFFLGRWIRFGGFYPDAKLRLFRKGVASFEPRPVHEVIRFDGASGKLQGALLHHAYPTLSGYLEHMNRYSTLGAEILQQKGKTSASAFDFIAHVFLAPAATFVWNYVFRSGFRDGREGLLLHLYHASYTSWKYAKAWEKAR
ncbi:glycosyltransferase family 2 protein [Terriglobus saanensis]|uniref:Glycosyl transferase family 2 n=1 Tax=Terriglobus saanensis (strain ATCC BAA-1853 / DSM 23119 / SP1PR4) TaxID=401053 RepID=E8V7N6_TERSS|nr:glycosyltransferase family 2 protein [Terriglobus saanensis]ADV81734.1 glycosyl transferase family 2 [Terriglobus saanensis SP1PR4]